MHIFRIHELEYYEICLIDVNICMSERLTCTTIFCVHIDTHLKEYNRTTIIFMTLSVSAKNLFLFLLQHFFSHRTSYVCVYLLLLASTSSFIFCCSLSVQFYFKLYFWFFFCFFFFFSFLVFNCTDYVERFVS